MNIKLRNAVDPRIAWLLINIIVAALWTVAAILYFIDGYFASVMRGIFLLIVGVVAIVLEFYRLDVVISSCGFFWNFMGRGIFNMLIGCVVFGGKVYTHVAGALTWVTGLAYIGLWFTAFELYPIERPPVHTYPEPGPYVVHQQHAV